jgi:hypothetical protein
MPEHIGMNMIKKMIGTEVNTGLKNELGKNRYYRFISNIQKELHSRIPGEEFDTTRVATPTDIRREIFKGVCHNRAVIYLLSNGCEWALNSAHGCTMCGHLVKQRRKNDHIPAADFIHQFEDEFAQIDFKKNPLLNLYNNGSFFNERELPPQARMEILKRIDSNPDIKMLVVETRPEFVTAEKLKEMRMLVRGKHIEVAVGLELKNDFFRRLCLNKGFSLKRYNQAARIITKYGYLRTYVFLKPPFLSEKESIEHAVETVLYAFARGSKTVSLEACTVQDFTLVKYLFNQNMYTPPWLWSILEVVKRSKAAGKLIIGMFRFYPSPTTVPYNCEHCSKVVMDSIREYNHTLDVKVFDNLDCDCKKKWKSVISRRNEPFEKRLEYIMTDLSRVFTKEPVSTRHFTVDEASG